MAPEIIDAIVARFHWIMASVNTPTDFDNLCDVAKELSDER